MDGLIANIFSWKNILINYFVILLLTWMLRVREYLSFSIITDFVTFIRSDPNYLYSSEESSAFNSCINTNSSYINGLTSRALLS